MMPSAFFAGPLLLRVRDALKRPFLWFVTGARGGLAPTDWIIALLIGLALLQGVRLFWVGVTPLGPYGHWSPAMAQIVSDADRRALFARFDPFASDSAQADAAPPLPLTLHGVSSGGAAGSAIVSAEDGVQTSVRVGENVAPGVILIAVAPDRIVVDQAGHKRTLMLPMDPAIDLPSPPAPATGSGDEDAPALTADRLRADIGFAPRMQGGRVSGVNVSPTGDGRVFLAAGFRPGDVIRSVNGQPITSVDDVTRLGAGIAPGQRLTIEVERGATIATIALLVAQS